MEKKNKSKPIEHILVTGISGSGKSTYARKIAEERKMPLIELDSFDRRWKEPNGYDAGVLAGFRRALEESKVPTIIEGQGIMRVPLEELSEYPLHIVRPDDETIISRRVERMMRTRGLGEDKRAEQIEKAKWLIANDRDNLDRLIQKHPKMFRVE